MSAYLVDELNDDGSEPTSGADLSAMEAQPAAQAAQEPTVLTGDEVPEKYRGKSAAELLAIVQNQESHIGKQGSELGELRGQVGTLRGLVDQSLALRDEGNLGRRESVTEDDLTDDQFITDPRDAVTRTVKRETREQNERLARLEKQNAALDFSRRYPEAQTDVEDPRFVEFVQNSQVRGRLANKAFQDLENIDFEAAEELFDLYNDYKTMVPVAPAADESASQEATSQSEEPAARQAPAMLNTGSSGDVGGSTKPIYSQAALNRLQANDPDTYWATDTQSKINKARAEGRILDDL